MSHNIKHTEEKHKKHKNTMQNFLQVNRALAAEKNYYFLFNLYAKILQKIGGVLRGIKPRLLQSNFRNTAYRNLKVRKVKTWMKKRN